MLGVAGPGWPGLLGKAAMYIAGRLALQSPSGAMLPQSAGRIAPHPDILSFHGCDVVVRTINQDGFEADLSTPLMTGALVRLRLPGAGAMLARVTRSDSGRIAADFVNPVPAGRLDKTIGMATRVQRVA